MVSLSLVIKWLRSKIFDCSIKYGFVKLITAKTLFINHCGLKTKFSPLRPHASPSFIYLARAASSRYWGDHTISIINSPVSSTSLEGLEGHLQMLIAEQLRNCCLTFVANFFHFIFSNIKSCFLISANVCVIFAYADNYCKPFFRESCFEK